MSLEIRPLLDKSKEERHFIEDIIVEDLESGKHQELVFRFPPEPNGHLHIGHAKAVCLNFTLGLSHPKARCHLRFDDTNPEKESDEFVEAIKKDIEWLGFSWQDHLYFASDYFDDLYAFAIELINKDLAYVDSQTADEIRENRGSMTEPGKASPFRKRSKEENLSLFQEMKEGKYQDGEHVLRAKIDMSAANINMRDPLLYRIRHIEHQRLGKKWCLYPLYDFTHSLSDALESVTHSLCTLEFQDHRPLYEWCVAKTSVKANPRQIEFAKLGINYVVLSKRNLTRMVKEKVVDGWDDPRMPTLSGMRRRGFPAKSIRDFCQYISVGKKESIIDFGLLEKFVRDELNITTKRVMAVFDPLKVTITNWEDDVVVEAPLHPSDESYGKRALTLTREIFIEASDFLEDPPSPKKWYRLGPDRRVRLRYGPILVCDEFIKDDSGKVIELKCHFLKGSFGGQTPEGEKKAKGIIHWVSGPTAIPTKTILYDRLFTAENPQGDKEVDFMQFFNSDSCEKKSVLAEPYIEQIQKGETIQFERMGYFHKDEQHFNRTATLKDNWSKK